MKHNSVWGKLLLLALSFVLAFSTLVSCTKDDVAALDKETDEIKTSLSTTAEDLANLKTLVNSIKATADAAAAKTALDAAIADLEAVKTTADAAATAAALADAKAAIEAAYASADTAVKTELKTAIDAVKATADAAAKAADLTAAKAALEAAIADKADKAALEAAIANINALLDEQVTAEDVAAAVKVVDDKLADYAKAADVATLTTALNEVAAKVEAIATDVATLKEKVAALEAAIADKTDVNDIKAQLVVINAAIEALQGDSNKFADEYELATRVLFGELVVYVVDGECFAVEADKVPEGVTANLRSIDAFKALVASVKDADYADGVLDDFKTIAATQEFFLGRAISVEAIEACFAKVETEKGSLETLVQTLERVLYKDSCNIVLTPTHNCDKTDGTHTEYCIKSIEKVYDKIVANNIEISDKLEARYNLLVAAYNNMVAAEAASEAIENMVLPADATVLYRDKASVLPAVAAYDTFKGTYFGTDKLAYTVFYGPSSVTAEGLASALIYNYDVMRKHEARLHELDEAGKAAAALNASFTSAEWYDEQRPLYTKAATLAEEVKAFDAWIAEYTLEEVNVELIVNDKYEILCAASDYATAMNTIWETYNETGVKASIVDAIAALKGAEDKYKTLITEKDAVADIRVLVDGLEVAIKAVDINNDQVADYTDKDGNFAAMVGDLANFVAIEGRIVELDNAKADIAEVKAEMDALQKVTYSDYKGNILPWREALDDIYEVADITVGDANYVELATAAEARWTELKAAYDELTYEILVIYLEVREDLDAVQWLLKDGKEIQNIMDGLKKINNLNITSVDLNLEGVVDGEEYKNIDLAKLYTDYVKKVNAYGKQATDAQTDAVSVNAAIANLKVAGFNAKDLKNYATVMAAYNAFTEWAEAHLAADITAADGNIAKAVADIKNVPVYGATNYYEFVTSEDYDVLVKAYADATKALADAKDEWATLGANMATLIANYNIHTYERDALNFVAVKAAYDKYVTDFYAGTIADLELVVGEGNDSELDIYNAFKVAMDDCKEKLDKAGEAADAIKEAIDELPEITMNNAAAVLSTIEGIYADLATYYATYCDDKCNCKFIYDDVDYIFALAKAKAKAEYSVAHKAEYDVADSELKGLIEKNWIMVNDLLDAKTDLKGVETIVEFAASTLEEVIADYVAGA